MTSIRWRVLLFLLVRVAVTVGLLLWVLARADLRQVGNGLHNAHASWLLLALALGSLNIVVGALRWRQILRALGICFSARTALRLCWSGQFFNTFLPSGLVGDALRSAWAAPGADPVRAAASVVLDRAAACVGLAIAVGAGLSLPPGRALALRSPLLLAAALVGLAAMSLLLFPGRITHMAVRVGGSRARRILGAALLDHVAAGPILGAMALAVVTESLIVGTGLALARSAGVPLSLGAALAVFPAAMVTAYVPFSISGIGMRDAALVVLLGQVGIPAGSALAISMLFLVTTWMVGLLGGLVYLLSRNVMVSVPVTAPLIVPARLP